MCVEGALNVCVCEGGLHVCVGPLYMCFSLNVCVWSPECVYICACGVPCMCVWVPYMCVWVPFMCACGPLYMCVPFMCVPLMCVYVGSPVCVWEYYWALKKKHKFQTWEKKYSMS